MKTITIGVALLLAGCAAAQQTPELSAPGANNVQFVTQLATPAVTVASGKPTRVELRFRVAAGDHINSSQPRSELLIPTRLKLSPPTDLGVGQISYPRAQELTLSFAPQEKLSVYSGEFLIGALVSAARTAATGPYRVHGELQYQACNDRQCFPPKKLPVAFDVNVAATPRAPRRNPGQSPHIHQ